MRPDHVFQDDTDHLWHFWDETGTAYLGPFNTKQVAIAASHAYSDYLMTGTVADPAILGQGNDNDTISWRDGEEF